MATFLDTLQSAQNGGGGGNINMPQINPIVGQPQTMDALSQAVMARGGGGFQPGAQAGRVAMPSPNAGYAQQYGNLMDAMMSRYPGQLRPGGSVFDAQPNAQARQATPMAPQTGPAVMAPPTPPQPSPVKQLLERTRSGY